MNTPLLRRVFPNVKVTCQRCNGPVERIEATYGNRTQALTITAICHGEQEVQTFRVLDIALTHEFGFFGEVDLD